MKKIKIIIIAFIIVFTCAVIPIACKRSFLNQTNTFGLPADAVASTKENVIASVNSIYDTYQNSDLLKKCIWYRANFGTHDFFNWGADVFWNNYQIPATFVGLNTLWNQFYIGIARANYALPVIEKARANGVVDASLADRLAGEAYFLRGTMYYYLTACFGGVPLELKTGSDGLAPRASMDSVFKQIVLDMQKAETLLWSKTALPVTDIGRATKGAAYAYEGAARMWLKDYAGALAAFNNAELTNNYHLLPNFVDVNEYDHQNNDESIFEIQFYLKPGDPQDWGGSWQPPGAELGWIDSFSWPNEITQQGYDYGNPALWNSYQSGDKRKLLTIVGPGDPILSSGIIAKWGGIKGYPPVQSNYPTALRDRSTAANPNDDSSIIDARRKWTVGTGNIYSNSYSAPIINTCGSLTYPWYGDDKGRTGYVCAKKWRDPNLTGNYNGPDNKGHIFGDQNQILMRYAEVVLSRAECKIRTGDVAGGLADIKLVRDRAWGGTAPAVMQDSANYDGTPGVAITDPLQMVLSEYRHELSGEYSTFFDILRAGTDVAVTFINKANGAVVGNYDPIPNPAPGPTHDGQKHGLYNTAIKTEWTLLPIPQSARASNPNLTQNPGY